MYKKLLKNPAFIFFIIAVLDISLIVKLTYKGNWYAILGVDQYIQEVTELFIYLCVPSVLLLIIQLSRKILKKEMAQEVLEVVNILVMICSVVFFLLAEYFCLYLCLTKDMI